MKKLICTGFSLLVFTCFNVNAQGLFNKIKDKVTDRANAKTDQAIDKGLDKTDGTGKKNSNTSSANSSATNTTGSSDGSSSPATLKTYKNYDFVPGDKIIFQSQLANESAGEIPSQFILANGQMDIQNVDGENVIHIPAGPGATMTPRMTSKSYMPDQFTIEFDVKNERFGINHVMVDFGSRVYYAATEGIMPGMSFYNGNLNWTLGDVEYPTGINTDEDHHMQWHHIAIAINKTVGKVYIDEYRVANVNNLTGKAHDVTIDFNGYEASYLKNIRIASGGIDIYKQVSTDGKIVTHGILFDVDKATIKPESMGTINSIYALLNKDASLKFEIDGHTDNTGDAGHNLTLSQQRADAVKTQLVSMGINASRLSTKGFGDAKPLNDNNSPEGKANNRRVEFVKI